MIIFLSVFFTILYLLLGFGFSKLAAKAFNTKIQAFEIVCWPLLLLVISFWRDFEELSKD